MDPNTNLHESIELAAMLVEHDDPEVARLAELVLSLNEWLKKGGAIPHVWSRPNQSETPC